MKSWPRRRSCLTRLKEAAGFSERIEGIGRDSLRFRQDAERLLQTVDPDRPAPGDRFQEAFEELFGRLRRAMTDQKNLDLLQSQRKKQEEKRQQAHTAVETLRARLPCSARRPAARQPRSFPRPKPPRPRSCGCGRSGKPATPSSWSLPRGRRSTP